jgi:protease I
MATHREQKGGLSMANELQGKRIAFVITPEGAEQVELVKDLYEAVRNAGGTSELLMTDALEGEAFDHLCEELLGGKLRSPRRVSTENASDYQGLVAPGVATADPSHVDQGAVSFMMKFVFNDVTANDVPADKVRVHHKIDSYDVLAKVRVHH